MSAGTAHESTEFESSLGPRVKIEDGAWLTDLTDLPIYHGLSVLAHALSEMVIAQAQTRDVGQQRPPEIAQSTEASVESVRHWAVSIR